MDRMKTRTALLVIALLTMTAAALADMAGKITGVIKDQTGSVIAGATVSMTNMATGAKQTVSTGDDGTYTFPVVAVGSYELSVVSAGFESHHRTGLVVDIDSALVIDVTLRVKEQSESLIVSENTVRVDTNDTQLGQVISSQDVTAIPLNGRSYTDLFATQVGVTPVTTSAAGNSTSGGGFGTVPVAGTANTGQFSINGQRENANGFSLNGASVQEGIGQQAGIIPNLDSIAEFRILTSNTDAEHGNYSGGLIDVVTKSGGNAFHGSAFEFLRNTALDAKSYFASQRSLFQQNQYGGTFGGPLKNNKLFFFADYQGQHTNQGQDTGRVAVPSLAARSGDFSSEASTLTGKVNGDFLAETLSNRLGYPVSVNEPFYKAGCVTNAECVFPNAVIPESAFALPATKLLQYIPRPNIGPTAFQSISEKLTIHDEKASARVDWNTDKYGNFAFYYFADKYNLNNPYPQGFARLRMVWINCW